MLLETTRFGLVDVDEAEAFEIPAGIPGFPDLRRAVLFGGGTAPGQETGDTHNLYWLQDLDNGDLAFMCIVPFAPFPDYDFEVDEQTLGIEDPEDVTVLTIVTVRRDGAVAELSTNLRAPLLIDRRHRRLHQVILPDSNWPIRAHFAELVTNGAR